MNQREYRQATKRTWNTDESFEDQLVNATLGLAGEWSELLVGDGYDEVGDVLYYLTTIRRLLDLEPIEPAYNPQIEFEVEIGRVAEAVKKHRFHGDELDVEEIDWATHWIAQRMVGFVDGRMADLRQQNIDKLRERFPDGFDIDRTGSA